MANFWKSLGENISTSLGSSLGGVPGALIGGAISSLFSRSNKKAENDMNLQSSKEMADYNQNIWMQQFNAQNDRQDAQLANQASLQKESLRNAGLNVALMNGSTPTTAGVSSPSGGSGSIGGSMQTPDLSSLMGISSSLAQLDLFKAQKEKTESEKEGQDIQNEKDRLNLDVKKHILNEFNQDVHEYEIDEDEANYLNEQGTTNYDGNMWKAGDKNFIVVPSNLGTYIGKLQKSEIVTGLSEQLYLQHHYAFEDEGWSYRAALRTLEQNRAEFNNNILNIQGADDKIINAIVHMPEEEYNNIMALTSNYLASASESKAQAAYLKVSAALAPYIAKSGRISSNASMIGSKSSAALNRSLTEKQDLENDAYGSVNPIVRGWTDFIIDSAGGVLGIVGNAFNSFKGSKKTIVHKSSE